MRSTNDSFVRHAGRRLAARRTGARATRRATRRAARRAARWAARLGALVAVLLGTGICVSPARAESQAATVRGGAAQARGAAKGGAVAAPRDLAALLAGFRTMPGFEARFEEEKTLALLAAPLASRGRLFFAPPGTLLRRIESPNPHDILIREHVVRIATPPSFGGGERRIETIDLARRADVRPLVESMLWIFSGDLTQLESIYAIDYRVLEPVARGGWRLRLAPRGAPLSQLIRELAITGHGHGADRLEITETSGDRTTTRILDANPARRFAAGEIERLFGLETP